jgi:hypothetical protein
MGFNLEDLLNPNFIPQQDQSNLPPVPLRDDYKPAPVNPMVLASLAQKYPQAKLPQAAPAPVETPEAQEAPQPSEWEAFKSKYSEDNLNKAKADAEDQKSGLGWTQFAAGLGDALAGRSSAQTAQNFENIRKGIDERTTGAFEKQKAAAVQDIGTKKAFEGSSKGTPRAKLMTTLLNRMSPGVYSKEQLDNMSADDVEAAMKGTEVKAKIDQSTAAQQMAHQDRMVKNEMLQQARGQKQSEGVDKLVREMRNDFDADKGRSGNFGQISAKVQSAERLQTLADAFKDGNLPPAQVEEFALGLSNMLAPGGGGSRAQVEALVPHSAVGDAQKLKSWLFNEPLGANQQKFVEMMNHTVQREKETASNQLNAIRASRLPVHETLKNLAPDRYNAMLQSYGLDPKNIKDGKYIVPNQSGNGDTVTIQTPDGRTGTIPRGNLEKALAKGAKVIQ